MMDEDAEGRTRPKIAHEIGSDLSAVSVGELRERIALLEAEIQRLQDEVRRKEASRDAAASFFRN